ncbi:MAG: TerB family tellurite resistance protein [Pseudomonadota bacterium]
MHIVGIIIAIVSGILIWQWRVRQAAETARELGDMVQTAANLPRRLAFKRKSGKSGLKLIEDPREAAAVMMLEIARADGETSAEAKSVMHTIMQEEFEIDPADADALTTHAAFLLRNSPVPHAVMDRMARHILDAPGIGPKEIVDLDGMLVAVTEADGPPSAEQLSLLQVFRNRTGVQT